MRQLYIDIETYSDIDLLKGGIYPYARSRFFELLLFAYAYDNEPVQIVDLANGEAIPDEVVADLFSEDVKKVAHNAIFERVCLSRWFMKELSPKQWRCTLAQCARMGLPTTLSDAARALKLDETKDEAGKRLINIFCVPQTPTKSNGMRTRVTPRDAPQMWQQFKAYCMQDVRTERAIDKATVEGRAVNSFENDVFCLDAVINDRGIKVDRPFVEACVKIDGDARSRLLDEAKRITGLDNPMSVQALTQWLATKGLKCNSLSAERIEEIKSRTRDLDVLRVLSIRQQLAKISTSKYSQMLLSMCDDDRLRGLFQYYGTHTGRWSSQLVQMHNLPKSDGIDIELSRSAVLSGDIDLVELSYGNATELLSKLLRTAFVSKENHTFVVCDYSAIEARVLAWLADDRRRLEIFRNDGKIYEATAAALYGVPVDEITADDPRRKHGKVAELALGYQGGVNALKAMGASQIGLSEDAMKNTVKVWRKANPQIVALWRDIEEALIYCVRWQKAVELPRGLNTDVINDRLYISLPSGRYICYPEITVKDERLHYVDNPYKHTTANIYGGRIVENIVQAIARDCLAEAMFWLKKDYDIVAHVHDEVVFEVPDEKLTRAVGDIRCIFSQSPIWAIEIDLPLDCKLFTSKFYK